MVNHNRCKKKKETKRAQFGNHFKLTMNSARKQTRLLSDPTSLVTRPIAADAALPIADLAADLTRHAPAAAPVSNRERPRSPTNFPAKQ